MFGDAEIGHQALGEVSENVAPSPIYSADAEFSWAVSADAEFAWADDETAFVWS